jgi:hypothetical protein
VHHHANFDGLHPITDPIGRPHAHICDDLKQLSGDGTTMIDMALSTASR